MFNMLRMDLRRLFKSRSFYMILSVTAVLLIMVTVMAYAIADSETMNAMEEQGAEITESDRMMSEYIQNTEFYPRFEAAGATPELRFEREDMKIWASTEALGRVYRNLIANALRHSGGALTISGRDGAICFSNPLPPGSRPDPEHLFDRFYQSNPARAKGGAGLGLSIVRELMERMDGQVSARITGDILEIKLSFRGA